MTGEMEKGMSISVARTCFPLNENFVRSHAAAIPKNVLTATAITVASRVTSNALFTYSVEIASK